MRDKQSYQVLGQDEFPSGDSPGPHHARASRHLPLIAALFLGLLTTSHVGCRSVNSPSGEAEQKLGLGLPAFDASKFEWPTFNLPTLSSPVLSSPTSPSPSAGQSSTTLPLYPSHDRDWAPQHARLPRVEFDGAQITVRDVRNFDFVTEGDYIPRFEDRRYDLRDLESVDYIVVPFSAAPLLAHTMLSFGFANGEYLVSSVEVRLEKGETYSPLLGAMRQFEIMYVLADERDAIRLRTDIRRDNVYVYRVRTNPEKARELFVDIAERVNQLYDTPEFYDTLTNNCTTNIVQHVNRIAPNRVPYGGQVLLPGLSGQLAYNVGLLDRSVSYEELQRRSNVTSRAQAARHAADFSQRIRR